MRSTVLRRLVTPAVLVLLALGCTACSGLEFSQDRRLSFVSPGTDSVNHLPVKLVWTMKNYSTSGPGAGEYAVFIDKSPMKVGKSIASLLPANVTPTAAVLANINVYVTRNPSVVLMTVPGVSHDSGSRQRHTATVVLLDASGKRRNESSWSRDFDVKVTS